MRLVVTVKEAIELGVLDELCHVNHISKQDAIHNHDITLSVSVDGAVQLGIISDYEEPHAVRDRVIDAVRKDFLQRSQFGIKKYGVTLERKDLKLVDWLEHAYTEMLDAADYLKRTIMELRGEI